MDFVEFGTPCATQDLSSLSTERARALYAAVSASPDFQLIELRTWKSDATTHDVLIVDCTNDQVPSRNSFGIKNRERLALVVPPAESAVPQARVLRRDFPLLPHINQVPAGEPGHLCLYLERWSETRRSWTPQRFLKRILWWLAQSSVGALHAPDQPLERLYFDFARQVIFPRDFERSLARKPCRLVVESSEKEAGLWVMRADFGRISARHSLSIATLVVQADTLVHGRVEDHPTTLGKLDEQFAGHGMSFISQLRLGLALMVACNAALLRAELSMIILDVQLRRSAEAQPEKRETRAFFLESLTSVGEQLGVLTCSGSGVSQSSLLAKPSDSVAWKDTLIVPVDVRSIPSRTTARQLSGVSDPSSEDRRTLIGVGALGSNLLELWTRASWGRWTIVDPDRVEAHNLVRHIARAYQIGKPKVRAVRHLMWMAYNDDDTGIDIVHGNAVPIEKNAKLNTAYATSSLIVDVSTTLTVPRELSLRDGIARCASTFVTPSGTDAVLMLEDRQRNLRLRDIEAQYYASLLADEWGRAHLGVQADQMRVGTGCRDASVVLSLEQIQLFGATLARQTRILSQDAAAHLRMWRVDSDGAIRCRVVELTGTLHVLSRDWNIVACMGIEGKLRRLRNAKLPVETGGVIVGYIDHQSRTIFVVDVLPAPPDSIESATGFIRGKEGLKESLDDISARTMAIVHYIGEWHSHPPRVASTPSSDDLYLSAHLAAALAADGDPALMIIVGDPSSRYLLSEAT